MCKKRFDDTALTGHVVDHSEHVVACCAHQCWTKYDGQVPRFHLVEGRVCDHFAQMLDKVLECFVVCFGERVHETLQFACSLRRPVGSCMKKIIIETVLFAIIKKCLPKFFPEAIMF